MTPKTILLSAACALTVLAGCRQKDFREVTIDLPGLAPLAGDATGLADAERQIRDAFATYESLMMDASGKPQTGPMTGVDLDSLTLAARDEGGNKTVALTVRFDSILVAEMNLVSLLDGLAVTNTTAAGEATVLRTAVAYPALTPGAPAGYINRRKPEVRD